MNMGFIFHFLKGLAIIWPRQWKCQIYVYGDILSYVASLLNLLKIYRNKVCVKEIQI